MKPDANVLFQLAEELDIDVLGTSASYLTALEKGGVRPGKKFNLGHLRTLLSTGSPLSDESFTIYLKIEFYFYP